jgi:tRNA A-37 threonylcarbamoyl transferase component Bud32
MMACPGREQLELLLAKRLDETARDELMKHVEDCHACQQTLDELTDGSFFEPAPIMHYAIADTKDADHRFMVGPLRENSEASTAMHDCAGRSAPTVAGYEIEGELGRGGMGVVYKARNGRLNRPCALKMILAGAHASSEEMTRFVTEAKAVARLDHPCIVQIRHIGDADGLPFLELEYVAGGSLDRELDGTPWPAERAARLSEQVARAIAEAHREGIIHRDLKPSNVLLSAEGTPKVGDFGLAKMLDSESALTRTESVMGSPSYMAPEQAQGGAKVASPAVDVYAVGAILYELLTGRPPFRGTTALETLEHVKTAEPVRPSQLVPGLPRDAETICLKCLEKEPGKRYASALDLAADLDHYLAGEPIVARPPSAFQAARYWVRKNLHAALWVLAVGLVCGALGGYATYLRLLQTPLSEAVEASYGRLHATPPHWLAAFAKPNEAISYAFGIAYLLAMITAGLAIVLLARPQTTGADLTHGLAVGLVAAHVSLMCGGAWAFAGWEVLKALRLRENVLAFKDDLLQRQREPLIADVWAIPGFGEVKREVYEPDWEERRYPHLKGMSREDQRRILYDKMVCDAIIGVQHALLWAMPLTFIISTVVPALEAVAAGSLWRRYQRPWPLTITYVERIVPLALTVMFGASAAWAAAVARSVIGDGWLGVYERVFWPRQVALVVLIVAQVAVWRSWPGWLRLLLHAGWFVFVGFAGLVAFQEIRLH